MTRNPIINAIAAAVYITIVGSLMSLMEKLFANTPDGFFAPIAGISLFTLSAGVMGYIFLLEPAKMYLDGLKKEGGMLFVKTLASFAVITVLLFALMILSR